MPESHPALKRELRLWDLVFFNVSAVAGIRWIAASAHAGPGSISLWVLAALFFFVPSVRVVASLSARFPEEGGFYVWTKHAFGDWHAFLSAWFYFIANIIYFPGLLLAGVSMTAYLFGPDAARIAESRALALPVTIALLWAACLLNLLGLGVSKWAANLGGSSMWIIGALLVVVGLIAALRYGSATRFDLRPDPSFATVNYWSQVAFAFIGLELGAILGSEIHDPRRTVPLAAWLSAVACAAFYIAGTAAMLALLKPDQISPLAGLAQAGQAADQRLGLGWLRIGFAGLIAVGVSGQLVSYLAGNTRLPYVIGLDRYLPAAFARLHPRWRTPHVSILTQAALATAVLLAMQFGETTRGAYQTLVDAAVISSFLPFVYIFCAAIRFGQVVSGMLGGAVSLLAIALSLVPPPDVARWWSFELKLIGGALAMGVLGWIVFSRARRRLAME